MIWVIGVRIWLKKLGVVFGIGGFKLGFFRLHEWICLMDTNPLVGTHLYSSGQIKLEVLQPVKRQEGQNLYPHSRQICEDLVLPLHLPHNLVQLATKEKFGIWELPVYRKVTVNHQPIRISLMRKALRNIQGAYPIVRHQSKC